MNSPHSSFGCFAASFDVSCTARGEGRKKEQVSESLICSFSTDPKMSYNPSRISPSPGEDPKGGSFLEESSGGGDDGNVLGGDSLVTGLLGTVLLVMCLIGMVGNIYTVGWPLAGWQAAQQALWGST